MSGSSSWTWGPGGTAINYAEWIDGRPNIDPSQEACLFFQISMGGWYDDVCGATDDYVAGALCEK